MAFCNGDPAVLPDGWFVASCLGLGPARPEIVEVVETGGIADQLAGDPVGDVVVSWEATVDRRWLMREAKHEVITPNIDRGWVFPSAWVEWIEHERTSGKQPGWSGAGLPSTAKLVSTIVQNGPEWCRVRRYNAQRLNGSGQRLWVPYPVVGAACMELMPNMWLDEEREWPKAILVIPPQRAVEPCAIDDALAALADFRSHTGSIERSSSDEMFRARFGSGRVTTVIDESFTTRASAQAAIQRASDEWFAPHAWITAISRRPPLVITEDLCV